ncbi:hypothetical protein [Acinetobacter sp. SH20PTE14]|uniref:hypothetical protein n=1 Tax=Acinetobacter sp. SH20PTE14 TaxID=2905879 RepID=UPI001F415E61|nr:hypothetical protein [Acinetobacter sp. SH20PTE14]UIJ77573.1 hypothetical protein LXF01_17400 [Acinetobacter sp. SH20PTE14]
MSENRFAKARQNKEFTHIDVNSDAKDSASTLPSNKIVTRNKSVVLLEPNKLPVSTRSRTKNGRNLTIPLFVEELNIIETAVNILGQKSDTSINNFIRQTILDKCKKIIGKEEYQRMLNQQLNVIKTPKEKN